ncbi:GTPase domain-containing protein [Aeromonas dhakensis]|nr:GTPase domain-containing protein [Aeromonas dhakensis]WAF75210.1 GTPase domain-containing protein [Aeromonas dhakensis]
MNHLTISNPVFGLIGIAISAVGTTISAPNVLYAGFATVFFAVIIAAYCSFPPKLKSASEFVGHDISIDVLHDIFPPILKVGIIGSTQSGKTTFLRQVLQQDSETTRTNKVYASIVALQTTPTKYIALLDGDGEQFSQQFKVAEHADLLLIFLDHSLGSVSTQKSKNRIEEHDKFIKQLIFHIKNGRIKRAHVLLNKRDLWEATDDASELKQWFEAHIEQLRTLGSIEFVTFDYHSNLISSDVGKIMRIFSKPEIKQ